MLHLNISSSKFKSPRTLCNMKLIVNVVYQSLISLRCSLFLTLYYILFFLSVFQVRSVTSWNPILGGKRTNTSGTSNTTKNVKNHIMPTMETLLSFEYIDSIFQKYITNYGNNTIDITDARDDKCYILALSAGSNRSCWQAGVIYGLASKYRKEKKKLRWDIVTGVSSGGGNLAYSLISEPGREHIWAGNLISVFSSLNSDHIHSCIFPLWRNAGGWLVEIFRSHRLRSICKTFRASSFIYSQLQGRRWRSKKRDLIVTAVSYESFRTYAFSSDLDENTFSQAVAASGTFPIMFKPSKIDGFGTFVDGGLRGYINVEDAIRRCILIGKAKSFDDIIVDVISALDKSPPQLFTNIKEVEDMNFISVFGDTLTRLLVPYFPNNVIMNSMKKYPGVTTRFFIPADPNVEVILKGRFYINKKISNNAIKYGIEIGMNATKSIFDEVDLIDEYVHKLYPTPYNEDLSLGTASLLEETDYNIDKKDDLYIRIKDIFMYFNKLRPFLTSWNEVDVNFLHTMLVQSGINQENCEFFLSNIARVKGSTTIRLDESCNIILTGKGIQRDFKEQYCNLQARSIFCQIDDFLQQFNLVEFESDFVYDDYLEIQETIHEIWEIYRATKYFAEYSKVAKKISKLILNDYHQVRTYYQLAREIITKIDPFIEIKKTIQENILYNEYKINDNIKDKNTLEIIHSYINDKDLIENYRSLTNQFSQYAKDIRNISTLIRLDIHKLRISICEDSPKLCKVINKYLDVAFSSSTNKD
ncbi:patatin-like phospholipase family protein [Cryptosporidium andersoni]|uniref:Patatin-like phospholipase family protein n=1 Tax=Cryptosporidium andersoni TaxID=117008 RepID=A0A1J4MUA5_9CRYT|nr:patatin-like phospholipase family protein [Cryptosporidium andersoni]